MLTSEPGNYSSPITNRRTSAGFSLLEVLLVLTLIAIVTGSILTGAFRDNVRVLMTEANRLQSTLEQLTYQALITGKPHGIVLVADQSNEYLPVIWRDYRWQEIDLPGLRSKRIERGSIMWRSSTQSESGLVWKVSPQGVMGSGVFGFVEHDYSEPVVSLQIGEDGVFEILVEGNDGSEVLRDE